MTPAPIVPPADRDPYGSTVCALAAEAVRSRLLGDSIVAQRLLAGLDVDPVVGELLRRDGATFVTLRRDGALRGCIGTLTAVRPVYIDVVSNARRAMTDPRLPPVLAEEWVGLWLSVSLLTPSEPLAVGSFDELYAALRPGVDGLTLSVGPRRATFLPTVWESLTTPQVFVAALLHKGGWRPDRWPDGLEVWRYGTDTHVSPPPRPPLG